PALDAALRGTARRFGIPGREGVCWPPWAASVVCAAVGVASLLLLEDIWSNRFFERDGTQRYFGRGPAPGFYPEGAADFILREKPPGEVMNMMTVGGYLAWRWFPARRVFIDGRLEVHDESLFKAYLRLQREPAVFEDLAKKYGVDTVVLSHRQSPESSALLKHLAEGGGWRPVYLDLSASVFMRGPAGGVDAPPAIDLRDPDFGVRVLQQARRAEDAAGALDPAPALLRRLLPRREVPVAEVNAALFFGTVGGDQAAETLFRAALAQTPHNPIIHYDLGLVLDHSGRPAAARSEFETALSEDASFGAAREALALRRLKDGDPEGALREWSIAERSGPLTPASLQARGTLLAGRGRIDEAIDDYRRAVDGVPWDSRLRADLAILYHRRGLPERAEAELRKALANDPRACAPRVALGRMRAADGRTEEAERAFREAIAQAEGGCPEAERALRDLQERKAVAR
ncbi:MAG TPA: tetratricopeptide repeat protein, partial [Candidatus Dormibacteraeota bacterium]|nr:tetratricopeptide repeat protein [Candidatus Dormibacteraeota bacterium]